MSPLVSAALYAAGGLVLFVAVLVLMIWAYGQPVP